MTWFDFLSELWSHKPIFAVFAAFVCVEYAWFSVMALDGEFR